MKELEMRVRVTTDGTRTGTRVSDGETELPIPNVKEIFFHHRAGEEPELKLIMRKPVFVANAKAQLVEEK